MERLGRPGHDEALGEPLEYPLGHTRPPLALS
jgi:hypothetical protein